MRFMRLKAFIPGLLICGSFLQAVAAPGNIETMVQPKNREAYLAESTASVTEARPISVQVEGAVNLIR